MDSKFLKEYINKSLFLQNKPLTLNEFKKECKNLGIYISNKELEVYEQKNLFFPIFRTTNYWESDELLDIHINSCEFHDNLIKDGIIDFEFILGNEEILSYYFDNNKIYPATDNNFLSIDLFKNSDGITLHENYYSIFQIELLEKIHSDFSYDANYLLDEHWKDREKYVNHKLNMYKCLNKNFNNKLMFLIYIQRFYYPYTTKDIKKYIRNFDLEWISKKREFKASDALFRFNYSLKDIIGFIQDYLDKFAKILNLNKNVEDWIYFWENVNFDYKFKFKDNLGLALFFLKIAIMLKYFVIDYSKETNKLCVISKYPNFLNTKNKFIKLYYLMNKLYLNYQPNLMVFVEGESEEEIIPKVFEWYYGIESTNLNIKIINIKGVNKLKSFASDAEKFKDILYQIQEEVKNKCTSNNKLKLLNNYISKFENEDTSFSNISSLISYNLMNWQIIPFFIFDDEGDISSFLNEGKIIKFDKKYYDVPDEWKYVWGLSNENNPLKGKDFELANFTDIEIKNVLNEILKDKFEEGNFHEISISNVTSIRKNNNGIKQICNSSFKQVIAYRKTEIVKLLFKNLFKEFELTNDEKLLNRPIFKLIDKINEIQLNYPKINDDNSETNFNNFIKNILEKKEDYDD